MGFYAPAQIVRCARDHGVEVRPADVNYSNWDNTLEPVSDKKFALRIGLRQIDGLREDVMQRLVAARDAPYENFAEMKKRARLDAGSCRKLAAADALRSMGLDRRQALWETQALKDAPDLPIFTHAVARDIGAEPEVRLPEMPRAEHVVADYQTLRLSLKAHPMRFFRSSLTEQGYIRASSLPKIQHGARVSLAGLVLVRQKPGSAKGVCFITLEDETGVANLVIWPKLFEAFRPVSMTSRLLVVQTDGKVIHVVANKLVNRTDNLAALSGERLPDLTMPTDEVKRPIPDHGRIRAHPRDVRVIPKSRDFH